MDVSPHSGSFAGANSAAENREKILSAAEIGLVNKRAQLSATVIGIVTAVGGALLIRRVGVAPNMAVVSGIGAGVIAAYIESREHVSRGMQLLALAKSYERPPAQGLHDEAHGLDLKAAHEKRYEAGVGGLHEFVDRYATTRGDH
ncbi:unnamed protein product [Parajaminaea phylloscopi]